MPRVCIDRALIGEPLHLLLDTATGMFNACPTPPADAWVLGDPQAIRSIDVLASLAGIVVPKGPATRFRTAFDHLAPGQPIRWRHAIPKREFDAYIASLLQASRDALGHECLGYYERVTIKARAALKGLERAHVDADQLRAYLSIETNPTNRSALESLMPRSDGLASSIQYCQTATVTGRLTVASGPRILTLPKRCRNVIKSRYPDGKVVSIDYRSLEPRIALFAVGRDAPDDIYDAIGSLGSIPDRKTAKIITISLLYGAADGTIGRLSGLRNGELRDAISAVSEFFSISTLFDALLEQARDGDTIRNGYGRCVRATDRRKLVNYYCQSTATDAALLGFARGIDLIRQRSWVMHPLFFIHDAMTLDVHPDFVEYIDEIRSECEGVPGYERRFPMTIEEL
jgi:hypothetical protein